MTKEKKIITAMTIILILLIAIFSYFLINKNATIEKQAKEIGLQAMETNESNSYVTTQEHLKETSQNIVKINEFKKSIANYIGEAGGVKPEYTANSTTFGESIKGILAQVTKDATATAGDISEGKTAWVNGSKITGTAATGTATLLATGTYTSPSHKESWATISYGKTLSVIPYIVINTYGANYSCLSYIRSVTTSSFDIYYNATNSGTITWFAFSKQPTV